MGDKDIRKKFGVSEEELDKRASEYESENWSAMDFGEAEQGRPQIQDEDAKHRHSA